MKAKYILSVVLTLCTCPLFSQPQETIFNITSDDYDFLHYLEFRNTFTYSGVEMRFGEIFVSDGEQKQRVDLVNWDTESITIQDAGGQVQQTDLEQYARSETFDLPTEETPTIEFYRVIGMWAPSNAFPPDQDDPPGGGPGNTPWDVLDRTEWELQLRDATNDNVLTILNTAGIDAHTDPYSNPFTGTDPRVANHSVVIPAEHAGKSVYIQVITRRWGTSPYGVTMMKEPGYFFNESAIVDSQGDRLDDGYIQGLHDEWFQAVIDYCDEIKSTTGWLPTETSHWMFSPAQMGVHRARYYEEVVIDGVTVMSQLPPVSGSVKQSPALTNSENTRSVANLNIMSVSPNPVDPATPIVLELMIVMEAELSVAVYNLVGSRVAGVWNGKLPNGPHNVSVNLSDLNLAAGSYSLVLENAAGKIESRAPITVVR